MNYTLGISLFLISLLFLAAGVFIKKKYGESFSQAFDKKIAEGKNPGFMRNPHFILFFGSWILFFISIAGLFNVIS